MSIAEGLILNKGGKVDFQMNTGKLEICMEKSTEKNWCAGKTEKYYYFLVFFRVYSLSGPYSMQHFGKYLANAWK